MIERQVKVHSEVGLHARPAANFVKTAQRFSSRITVTNLTRQGEPVDAKSLLQLLKIAVAKDHEIRIVAEGDDEQQAVDTLADLVETTTG